MWPTAAPARLAGIPERALRISRERRPTGEDWFGSEITGTADLLRRSHNRRDATTSAGTGMGGGTIFDCNVCRIRKSAVCSQGIGACGRASLILR